MLLLSIIAATGAVSLVSLISVSWLAWQPKKVLQRWLLPLVAMAAGTLMAAGLLHLLPEAVEHFGDSKTSYYVVLASFGAFFLLEKVLHWQHCHQADCDVHSFGYMNLLGDAIHNFLDGLIMAAAFSDSISLGLATTVAIILHEIPQEIGDFGVLLHAGFSKKQALGANFLVALTALLGGLVGYWLTVAVGAFEPYLVAIAAGGFLYIASADLLPEIRKEQSQSRTALAAACFVGGILVIVAVSTLSGLE